MNESNKERVSKIILLPCILLFTILFAPKAFYSMKIILMVITILLIFMRILTNKRILISKQIIIWFIIYLGSEIFFVFMGFLKGTPGVKNMLTVTIMWPVFYFIIILGTNNEKYVEYIFKTIKIAIVSIISYDLFCMTYILIFNSFNYSFDIGQEIRYGIHSGYVEFSMNNFGALSFIAPIISYNIFCKEKYALFSKKNALILFLLTIATILLSGRRAIQLVLMISIILSFIITSSSFKIIKNTILFIGIIVVTLLVLNQINIINIVDIVENITNIFDGNKSDLRFYQIDVLINGFKSNPLIGSGYGAIAEGMIRSYEKPWEYELSYFLKLFNTGIIGIVIFLGLTICIFVWGIKILRSKSKLSKYYQYSLIGLLGILMANATNPYLQKFDYMWIYFLPILIVNSYFVENKKSLFK